MNTATNRIVGRGLGFLPAMGLALFLSSAALAVPFVDNNAGIWMDAYDDSLGVQTNSSTAVDPAAGVIRLEGGQTSGSYETVTIKPPSFGAWGTLTLSGIWSAPSNVQVTVINATNRNSLIGPVDYTGEISLAGIDPVAHPELAVLVTLTEGTVSPMISDLGVTWSPRTVLLMDKTAPESVLAGQQIAYRIRYSVNNVEAENLVVWDKLPRKADGTMTYPADYGQNDDVTFVEASRGGVYTETPVTVHGVQIPADSVYWDLGTKPEGTTETLWFTVRTRNGTLNGSQTSNRAVAVVANITTVNTVAVQTRIDSQPAPTVNKRVGAGITTLASGNYTRPGALNRFIVDVGNRRMPEGRETMYGVVVYDDLSGLMGKIDPDLGGTNIPVEDIYPPGGTYVPAYTPPAGGASFPAVVWTNCPTLGPGEGFKGAFTVRLLDAPPLPDAGSYTNTAWLGSHHTDPLTSSKVVSWPVDETPYGIFAKGDNLDSTFNITAFEDDPALFVRPGASYPYGLSVRNIGIVALNDLIFVDRIPDGTTFKSAWFTDPWLQTNAVIFYSTVVTADTNTPPTYGTNNVPADLDIGGADYWSAIPPTNLADVTWVAFYIPAVNSLHVSSGSSGWVDGAPRAAVGYFDVTVSPTFLEPDPCVDKLIINRGHFNAFSYTPLAGGSKVDKHLSTTNDETTRVALDKPKLAIVSPGRVTPSALSGPGPLTYTISVKNTGTAMAENVRLEIRWPRIPVNGVPRYLLFDSVTPASISEFEPDNGRLVLEMGTLAPGGQGTAMLTVNVPEGIVFGQPLTFTSTATVSAVCPPGPVTDTASAVARFAPSLKVHKNDVLDLIPSGGTVDYTLTLYNTGDAPSHGTFLVDRIPDEMVLVHATGPNGERVWFSATDNLPPAFLSSTMPIDAATIAANFSLGTPNGDVWESSFGEQTRWVAWEMDCEIGESKFYPVGCAHVVGLRLKNDLDGPGPGTEGSPQGTQIFNIAGVFSDELLQAIGNEVVTTIKLSPGLLVEKTGPDVVSKGDIFSWTVNYYNNSGIADDVVTLEDTLPEGVEFLSATHTWNATALTNGAPVDNSGQSVPSTVEPLTNGATRVVFHIAGANGYRGANAKLLTQEGGTITLTVRAATNLLSHAELLNRVVGTATTSNETVTSSDDHLVLVRNAEIRVRKIATPEFPVAGDTVIYNLIVGNSGKMAALDLVVTDRLPEGVSYVEESAMMLTPTYSIGQPAISGDTLIWSVAHSNALTKAGLPPGELPARSGDVVIQYKGVVDASVPAGTPLTNTVTVSTVTPEDDTEPNEDEAAVRTPYPDPVIHKDGPAIVQTGDRFDWTLTYYNATRQAGENVYILDTLPDADGDGQVDVTFVEQQAEGPGAVTAYYHSSSSTSAPPFNPSAPLAGGWTDTPHVPVQHIAWVIGALPGSAGPYTITVTVIAGPPSGTPLAAGTPLRNFVEIFVSGPDQNPNNNTDEHTPRTPANDVALTKTGSTEGDAPGLVPGEEIVYEIVVENTGTEIAYGIEVEDILPDSLQLAEDGSMGILALVNADGEPVLPVDADGYEISAPVPLTRVVTTNGVVWTFGSTNASSDDYYRNIGILPGQKQALTLMATVASDVPSGTRIINTATVTLRNRNDDEPEEAYLGNNSDSSETIVYRPDVAVLKSVADATTGDADWTEKGSLLTYTIEYSNLGEAVAKDTVVSEIVPEGTTLVSVQNPAGSTVTYYPAGGAEARGFDVHLGDLRPNPNKATMVHYAATAANTIRAPDNFMNRGSIAVIGDVNGDNIPDLITSANADHNNEPLYSGGAQVILMNADGTAKETVKIVNGSGGIPPGTFQNVDYVGKIVAGLGDVDGDGIPDVFLAQTKDRNDKVNGLGYVWMLNSNGTVRSFVALENGINGIPAGFFPDRLGGNSSLDSSTDFDRDGVRDILVGNDSEFYFGLLLLNTNGTVRQAIDYGYVTNSFPAGVSMSWGSQSHPFVIGDVDDNGVQDLFVRTPGMYGQSGGGLVVLLETNFTAKSVVCLANGQGGVPADCFNPGDLVGYTGYPLGDFNGDGIPDVLLGARGIEGVSGIGRGGAVIMLLDNDGTAKDVIKLVDGTPGIPEGSFDVFHEEWEEGFLYAIGVPGDVDGDGVTDIMFAGELVNEDLDMMQGLWFLALMNPDGTVKALTRMIDGEGGIPDNTQDWEECLGPHGVVISDIDGSGTPGFACVAGQNVMEYYISTVHLGLTPVADDEQPITFAGTTVVERRFQAGEDAVGWDRIETAANVPEGTTLTYSIGRLVNGKPVYDLGPAFMDLPHPLPAGGLDISSIPGTNRDLMVKVAYTGTEPPTVDNITIYTTAEKWSSFTFTVLVDDPVAASVLPDINNTVSISTVTPESDTSNNSDDAEIMVRTLDLEVAKTADKTAAFTNELVTFTLTWRNHGPWAATNAVLEDVLPAGLTFVSSTPAHDAVAGNVYSWNLGDVAANATGAVTVVARVAAGTDGQTLVNTTRIRNDRQETDYTNNEDSVPVVVKELANVWIEKNGPATVRLGSNAVYTLTYGNNGNATASYVTVADTLPAGMTYVSAVPPAAGTSDNPKTWWLGTLASGATGTITVTVHVADDYSLVGTPLVNNAEITTTTPEVTITDNKDDHSVDPIVVPASLGDRVWWDANRNGIQDSGETRGIENLPVALLDANSNVVAQTTTDENGNYLFAGLMPGTYTVQFDLSAIFAKNQVSPPEQGTDDALDSDGKYISETTGLVTTDPITIASGDNRRDVDLGIHPRKPTRADVVEVWGEWRDGRGIIGWRTASEWGTAGFLLTRVDEATGAETPLNTVAVPASLAANGAIYSLADLAATQGGRGRYRLTELEFSGELWDLGTHDVTFGEPPPQAVAARSALKAARATQAARAPSSPAPLELPGPSPVLKVQYREPGIYAVNLADLATGMGRTVDELAAAAAANQLAVTQAGTPLATIYDKANARLLFYGPAADNWYVRDNAAMISIGPGFAMPRRTPAATSGETTLPVQVRFEEDRRLHDTTAQWPDDIYYWNYVIVGNSSYAPSFPVDLTGCQSDVQLTVRLKGWNSTSNDPDHCAEIYWNDVLVATNTFDDAEIKDITFTVPAADVVSGVNTLVVKGFLLPGCAASFFVVDWMDASFERSIVPQAATAFYQADAAVSAVSAAAYTEPVALALNAAGTPTWLADENGTLPSRAFAAAEDDARYALAEAAAIPVLTPTAVNAQPWFLSADNRVDYLIITSRKLEDAAQTLADYRAGQGLRVGIATFEDLADTFAGGLRTPEAIPEALRYAAATWAEAPWLVVFAGNGHYDFINALTHEANHVPPMMWPSGFGTFAADALLTDLDEDGLPDIAAGRLPAQTPDELTAMVAKIQAYEEAFAADWTRQLVLVADKNDRDAGDFRAANSNFAAQVGGRMSVASIELDVTPGEQATAALINWFNTGAGIIHYTGHGNSAALSKSGLFDTNHAAKLSNTPPPVVLTLSCFVGHYERPEDSSLSERLLAKSGGGAVATWSPSGPSLNNPAVALGAAFYEALLNGGANTLGQAVLHARRAQPTDLLSADTYSSYNLLGDPALRIAGNIGDSPAATSFAQWRWGQFTPADLANDAISGNNAENFRLYALGSAGELTAEFLEFGSASAPGTRGTDEGFIMRWKRRAHSRDLIYRIYISPDLQTWQPDPEGTQILGVESDPDGVMETVRTRVNRPDMPSIFIGVKAEPK